MATDKNQRLLLGIAGGAAVGIYFVVQKQNQVAAAAAAYAQNTGSEVPPTPSILDIILGKIPELIEKYLPNASALEATIRARGPKHLSRWKRAIKAKAQFYAVDVGGGDVRCFVTGTGEPAAINNCSEEERVTAQLEGYF